MCVIAGPIAVWVGQAELHRRTHAHAAHEQARLHDIEEHDIEEQQANLLQAMRRAAVTHSGSSERARLGGTLPRHHPRLSVTTEERVTPVW